MCAFQRVAAEAALMLVPFTTFIAPASAQSPPKPSDCDWIELSPHAVDVGRADCSVYQASIALRRGAPRAASARGL